VCVAITSAGVRGLEGPCAAGHKWAGGVLPREGLHATSPHLIWMIAHGHAHHPLTHLLPLVLRGQAAHGGQQHVHGLWPVRQPRAQPACRQGKGAHPWMLGVGRTGEAWGEAGSHPPGAQPARRQGKGRSSMDAKDGLVVGGWWRERSKH